jgi:hypothetical protein
MVGPVVSQAACGVVGDGRTDDWQALQHCVDRYDTVVLAKGFFRLSQVRHCALSQTVISLRRRARHLLATASGVDIHSASMRRPFVAAAAAHCLARGSCCVHGDLVTCTPSPHIITPLACRWVRVCWGSRWCSRELVALWLGWGARSACSCRRASRATAPAPVALAVLPGRGRPRR